MKRLIVTGDDFGASLAVNEAIEQSCRSGILNTASLMVGAPAYADAIERARKLPELGVGLHLVLVCGKPVLPPSEIPDLVGPDGVFSTRLVRAGFSFFFRPSVRRQLAAEIRAQFERFKASGLPLDHVNAHNHMHMHPTVFNLILSIGAEYGLRAVRLPHEPFLPSWRATGEGLLRRCLNDILLRPLIGAQRRKLARAGFGHNDYVFGMNDNGAMDSRHFLAFLDQLPDGVSEIFCHPATGSWPEMEPEARHYRVSDEFAALKDATVAAAMSRLGIEPVSFHTLGTGTA